MHPESKSPLEAKYERLRGMCGVAWENVRYIPIDNGIQQHGRAWRSGEWQGMAVYDWRCVYIRIPAAWRQGSTAGRKHGIPMQQWVYLCTIYDMRTQYTTAITRASQRLGACIACVRACVILLYYYIIIILLYYYIYIYPIYPVYPVYPIYPTMVI